MTTRIPISFGASDSVWDSPTSLAIGSTTLDALYPPLPKRGDPIRLLTIHKGVVSDPITCTLKTVLLKFKPSYEALSYTWGTSPACRSITVNSLEFPVRENLFQFLSCTRRSQKDCDVWVDAICIRQDSIPEKNQQVACLHATFSEAKRVLVWLGLPTEESRNLYDYMDQHFRQAYRFPNDEDHVCQNLALYSRAMISLLNRPYWSRTWIVQECILAREVYFYCGTRWVDDEKLLEVCNHLTNSLNNHAMLRDEDPNQTSDNSISSFHDTDLGPELSSLFDSRFLKMESFREDLRDRPSDLFAIIMNFSETQCLDPRDKVYALQRLCYHSNVGDGFIPWDYGVTTDELFCRALIVWRQRSRLECVDLLREALRLEWHALKELPRDHYERKKQRAYGGMRLSLPGVKRVSVTKILSADDAALDSTTFEATNLVEYDGRERFKFLTKSPVCIGQDVLYFEGAGVATIINNETEHQTTSYLPALPVLGIESYKSLAPYEPFSSILSDASLFTGLTVHEEGKAGDVIYDPGRGEGGGGGRKRKITGPRVELSLYQLASIGACYEFLHPRSETSFREMVARLAPTEEFGDWNENLLDVFEEEAEENHTLGLRYMITTFGFDPGDLIGRHKTRSEFDL